MRTPLPGEDHYGEAVFTPCTVATAFTAFITSSLNGWNNIEDGATNKENAKEKGTYQEQEKMVASSLHTKL